ncbi:hypothetical protein KFL_005380020 [Klebsormidium nitens]|uniref:Uncharacterized protein n=1 Tax=Klebsormidium nitens TaxID=105231 RepID=A0A1Y1ILD4_KLENI|nr:hypothetical protein KFL_005380020 [Klebsormidium nitens]|eukprot:GAQ89576.1 hypothetical protein KFL_005380020 [Klebsormidium nitens]
MSFQKASHESPVGGLLFLQSLAADRKVSPFKKPAGPVVEDASSHGYKLLDFALKCDLTGVEKELAAASLEDVNYIGTRLLKVRTWEVVLNAQGPVRVAYDYTEYKTDSTPLFAAAHLGNGEMVEKLVAAGADANARVFRGYPSTAAAQEGHAAALQVLISKGKLSVEAIEEALLEAALHNRPDALKLLLDCHVARDPTLQQALVQASSRGHLEIVQHLIEAGIDVNCSRRILVQCAQPPLHLNATCTPLIAAVVSCQKPIVDALLLAGASLSPRASLGAWAWDQSEAEELKVGAGLGEPYGAAWAAVEFCRGPLGGEILEALMRHADVSEEIAGRTLLYHAVLCGNAPAVSILLQLGASPEQSIPSSSKKQSFQPIYLAARLGDLAILNTLLAGGCDLNCRNDSDKTPAMTAAENGQMAALGALIVSGADLGLVDGSKRSLLTIADESGHGESVRETVRGALIAGRYLSSDPTVFHPLLFAATEGDVYLIRKLLKLDAGDVVVPPEKLAKGPGEERDPTDGAHVADSDSHSPTSTLQTADSPSTHRTPFPPTAQAPLTPQDCPPVEIEARDSDGNTALILCAQRGHLGAFEVLLRAGASLGALNAHGDTALTSAERNGSLAEAADVILEALRDGAVAVTSSSPGFFPLHFASTWQDERAMAAVLKASPAHVDELDNEGLTPVMICAQQGFVEGVRLLLEAGAHAEKRGPRGLTALQLAREQGPKVSAAVEKALFDHLARKLVLTGAPVLKHTREGRGKPHEKVPCMRNGVFYWGEKGGRKLGDVVAELGGGPVLRKNRPKESSGLLARTFSVEARAGRTVYFTASSQDEAEMWVHGINMVAQEAAQGGKSG